MAVPKIPPAQDLPDHRDMPGVPGGADEDPPGGPAEPHRPRQPDWRSRDPERQPTRPPGDHPDAGSDT